MMKQIYFDRLEKGIKIIRTYDIMINQQQNYKTLPHYMKVFGDFGFDYLKYKVVQMMPEVHHMDDVKKVLNICDENQIEVSEMVKDHIDLIEKCRALHYTDVSECMKLMPTTAAIMADIMKELNMEM